MAGDTLPGLLQKKSGRVGILAAIPSFSLFHAAPPFTPSRLPVSLPSSTYSIAHIRLFCKCCLSRGPEEQGQSEETTGLPDACLLAPTISNCDFLVRQECISHRLL